MDIFQVYIDVHKLLLFESASELTEMPQITYTKYDNVAPNLTIWYIYTCICGGGEGAGWGRDQTEVP